MWVARTFHVAQPALLYIVPATLAPVVLRAWLRGPAHLKLLWGGVSLADDHFPCDTHSATSDVSSDRSVGYTTVRMPVDAAEGGAD